jgi:hypothetical protein
VAEVILVLLGKPLMLLNQVVGKEVLVEMQVAEAL